jgi:hypothetical protein
MWLVLRKYLNSKHFILFLFTISSFLCFTIPGLVSDGMTMDGTLYACIARNLAEGTGSFWQLHFSKTFFNVFYEHPPLAIAIESIWFKILGDSIYVERLYSFTTLLITSGLIILIWKEITNDIQTGWIPLLFYYSVKKISWAFANNMLENTMVIFICISALLYLKSLKQKHIIYLLFSGLSVLLAFFSKGFTSLFIFTLPFFLWLFQRKTSFWKMVTDSFIIIIVFLISLSIIYYCITNDSRIIFMKYISQKVFGKLDLQTVDTRFFILIAVFYHFIPTLIISFFIVLSARMKQFKIKPVFPELKNALTFLTLAASGILPIIISLKQSGYYAITTYPFIAIAFALIIQPYTTFWIEKFDINSLVFRSFRIITLMIFALTFVLFYYNYGRIGQDKLMIEDCHKIIEIVGENSTIGLSPNMEKQYYLYAYYNRYGHVNLDQSKATNYEYILTSKDYIGNEMYKDYKPLNISTQLYILLKKNELRE